jgi:hypothetical protein
MNPPIRTTMIAAQIVGLLLTGAILLFDLSLRLPRAEEIGGTMTLLLILAGIALHLQSRRGRTHPGLLAAICGFGPVYAMLAGPVFHVAGYHLVAGGFHGLVWWNLRKRAVTANEGTDGEEE